MEVLACSVAFYGQNSCELQDCSVTEFMDDAESNCVKQAKKQASLENKNVDHLLPDVITVPQTLQCDVQETTQEPYMSGKRLNDSPSSVVDANGQTSGSLDYEDNLEEQSQGKEACLNFENSHVDVNTIDSEPVYANKMEELSVSASRWPEHDEALALWVKWRGKWQAGIKCERADWPLATVKAKPTHDRKSYIVIFFPHTRNYSWADTLLVCAIDEFPQPIAHRSYKAGVRLVEDLTVARRFIMKKLVIGVLNIVDQLPIQVLAETARDVVVWREFAAEASRCKGYPDLGRLLLKLQNMLLQQYVDAIWLQHSFQLWEEKCRNALSADSIEILKEELVDSILWSEVNSLRDVEGQPALGSDWKMWKQEVMKCFSTAPSVLNGGDAEQPGKNTTEHLSNDTPPLVTSPQVSWKRPKLEVRRAETHNSVLENNTFQNNAVVEIDSSFFRGIHDVAAHDIILHTEDEFVRPEAAGLISISKSVDRQGETVDASNAESVQKKDDQSEDVNGVVVARCSGSKTKNRQCTKLIEAKGRRCVRWANEGDEYCCVHLASRVAANSEKMVTVSSAEAPMCQGTTTVGHRCKHRSLAGLSFCKKHRIRSDAEKSPSSPGSQLKRKHDELFGNSELTTCKDIVIFGKDQLLSQEPLSLIEDKKGGENYSQTNSKQLMEEFNSNSKDIPWCLGSEDSGASCPDSPTRHSLYCDKHIPSWLKRARNGKSRIISKEIFLDLLKACSSQKQKIHLHQACELFYKLFKNILSVRNQVPKEIQFQWALSEASKEAHVAELLMTLVSREKERLCRLWGSDLNKDEQVSSHVGEKALVPVEEKLNVGGTFKCTICSEEFPDDATLGEHWIDSHNKEAQWLFRGYACAICLDSFTNRKVLETHVQERHHAQFVEHCMLIQCIPCGSHFGNSEELWSHVLSAHTERFRQSNARDKCHLPAASQPNPISLTPISIENSSGNHSSVRKFVCRFCGLKFDLLPDLGRHHQAAHMGPSSLNSLPKKKGLRFYTYRLKSGRLSRPRLKKGLGGTSYRLRNKGTLVLKKRLQPSISLSAGGFNLHSHGMVPASLVRLSEAQCSAIAKMLFSEAQKTKPRPNNHEIFSIARSACCKVGLHRSLEQKYGALPERLYLKAAKLCSENNIQVNWHQEGFNCPRGCKPQENENMVASLTPTNKVEAVAQWFSNPQLEECEMDECHYVIDSGHFRRKQFRTTIILCDDLSFGQENVPVRCVVDKPLIDSLHSPAYSSDGKVVFMPWESFTYVTKPVSHTSNDVNYMNFQLGCGCSQSTCSGGTCDHVYLFNSDYKDAKDIDGKLMEGRFPYDDDGRLILEDGCLVYECNHLCKCSTSCPNRVLQKGVRLKLEVFKTEKKGWAVRTCETIKRGTFVCEFVGEVLDLQEVSRRRKRYGKEGSDYIYDPSAHMQHMNLYMDGEAIYAIDATKYGNVSRFINHSCSPNLERHLVLIESMDFQLAHVGLYAKQDIEADEELSLDYHYELLPEEAVPCLCGATTCRGRLY